jgi:hypothetical protein
MPSHNRAIQDTLIIHVYHPDDSIIKILKPKSFLFWSAQLYIEKTMSQWME